MRWLSCTWPRFFGVTSLVADEQIPERGGLEETRIRAAPKRSTCVSRSRAQRSASALLSKDFALGSIPQLRSYACQRPLSFLIVATAISGGSPEIV